MCEICESMLAAEHQEQPDAPLCPKCNRFPLAAEVSFDLSQWDYVAPELREAQQTLEVNATAMPFPDGGPELEPEDMDREELASGEGEDVSEDEMDWAGEEVEGEMEEGEEEHVQTCYHCYQAASGLAERCPVCGDSYLPPELRKPHSA